MQAFKSTSKSSGNFEASSKGATSNFDGGLGNLQRKGAKSQRSIQLQATQDQADNSGLPDNLKTGIENLSGVALDDVKVHYNSDKPSTVGALAYAQGTDIHLGSGQEKHLPHEAWHVVQQKQGKVKPTTTVNGTAINDDPRLEREADTMGAKAIQMVAKEPSQLTETNNHTIPTAQLEEDELSVSGTEAETLAIEKSDLSEQQKELKKENKTETDTGTNPQEKIIPNQTEDGLEIASTVNDKDKQSLADHGKAFVGNSIKITSDASTIGFGVKSMVDTANSSQGSSLLEKVTGTFSKAMGSSTLEKVASGIIGIGGPVISAISNILSAKSKWSQWFAFEKSALDPKTKTPKADAPPEAIYALTKIWKGFARTIKNIVMAISNFLANLLLLIPGAQIVGAPWKAFNTVVGVFDSAFKSIKSIWQHFRGEKKVENSDSLLNKAINGDQESLQLIFDLKLGSITGSGFTAIDYVTGGVSNISEYIKVKLGLNDSKGERVIDMAEGKLGGPTSTEELHTYLQVIKMSNDSKKIILEDLKESMTGYGT